MSQAQETKNQHYVPQGYLKKFTYDNHRLYVFDKFTGRSNSRSTRSVASALHFNDFHPDIMQDFYDEVAISGYNREMEEIIKRASDPQLVEHEFATRIEPEFYRERDRLLNTVNVKGSIAPEQKEAMAYFMTMQQLRLPQTRKMLIEGQERIFSRLVEEEGLYVEFNEIFASLEHAQIMFSPDIQQACVEALCNHIWIVGINQTPQPLYTSDTPIVMKGHSVHRGIGVGVPGIEIAFPLDPQHILILLEKKYFKEMVSQDCTAQILPTNKIIYYNRLQVLRSYQQVYSPSDDFSLARQVCSRFPNICSPNREPVRTKWIRPNQPRGRSILHSQIPDPDRVEFEVH